MPRVAQELKALQVARISEPGMHAVGKVPGLHLQVTLMGARSWVLRVTIGGKRCEIGLGSYPAVTLAAAHTAAESIKSQVRAGANPLQERREARSRARSERATEGMTFSKCATAYIAAHRSGWKNDKHAKQWESTLERWAYPKLGATLVRQVELAHVLAVLEQPADSDKADGPSFWSARTETASRVRGRMEAVLDWATVRELRHGANPARWRGHLDKILPAPRKVAKPEHHAAVAAADMPDFMNRLRQREGMAALALEFLILTAARSGEVRGATWSEIDREGKVWTVSAARMKAGREHQVPLSAAALSVLAQVTEGKPTDLVFPSPTGGMLSDMTLTAVMRRMEVPATVHGFRSTFRDWCGDRTNYPRDLAEMALAHTIKDKAEAAYRRGDMLARRVPMMEDWARFIGTKKTAGSVVQLDARAAA